MRWTVRSAIPPSPPTRRASPRRPGSRSPPAAGTCWTRARWCSPTVRSRWCSCWPSRTCPCTPGRRRALVAVDLFSCGAIDGPAVVDELVRGLGLEQVRCSASTGAARRAVSRPLSIPPPSPRTWRVRSAWPRGRPGSGRCCGRSPAAPARPGPSAGRPRSRCRWWRRSAASCVPAACSPPTVRPGSPSTAGPPSIPAPTSPAAARPAPAAACSRRRTSPPRWPSRPPRRRRCGSSSTRPTARRRPRPAGCWPCTTPARSPAAGCSCSATTT